MSLLTNNTIFEPSADDSRIRAVLDARVRLEEAFEKQDAGRVTTLLASDVLVNAPINRVVAYDNILARFKTGQIHYESAETRLEFAGVRADFVVLMGEEIVRPIENTPNVGKTVRRRFTDIWREDGGVWKLLARQGTAYSIE
ncbi:MAG TPA: nuclear transport factor 2 family protein [Alphaproteobacteria bacterium]|nr:nuclear transport factor 2 family protein [Alphaproteobacteria bacterium]